MKKTAACLNQMFLAFFVLVVSAASLTAALYNSEVEVTASDGGYGFGNSVAISGDTFVVGTAFPGDYTGAAYVFIRDGAAWTEQAKLMASDPGPDQWFGGSVAIQGDTIVVGSVGVADAGSRSGAAYVFVRNGANWTQQARLTASDNASGLYFGLSVGISGDTVVVGAEGDQNNGPWTGAAYVFQRSGTNWSQQAKLVATDAQPLDYLGWSVAIDGDTVLAGAQEYPAGTGSVHVFVRSGGLWAEQAKLVPADGSAGDIFSSSVALDGNVAAIGAAYQNSATGAVYVFERSGASWMQQAKLMASDAGAGDYLGFSIGISKGTIIAGSLKNDWAGSAYAFVRRTSGWVQLQKLVGSDTVAGDHYGQAVGISSGTIVVGAYLHSNGDSVGAAYVYSDTEPPTISSLSVSPNVLWPPNRRMVPVTVTVGVTDNCDPSPTARIISITSNQPAGPAPDWIITGDLTAKLRAERVGNTTRVYTITVQCSDVSGNTSTATTTVTVPHSHKR